MNIYQFLKVFFFFFRARFESLCNSLKTQCLMKIEQVLSKAGIQKSDIEKVK